MSLLRAVTKPSLMREMDDNYHSKSDNIDTERLNLKVTQGVVSTVYPRDKTLTQLLHKPITDELTANIALAEIDFIHFDPLILQGLWNALLTKREDVIMRFFKQWLSSRDSPSRGS